MVNARFNYEGTPVTMNLGLPLIDGEYTGNGESDEKEAGSGPCFNKILETLETYGITMIDEVNKSVYEVENFPAVGVGVSEQCRSAVFDGEYCYNGAGEKNVKFLFRDPVRGYGDSTFITTHDAPHSTDLLKDDGASVLGGDYVRTTVHTTVKAIYSHFSRSPHRCRGLCALAAEWGVEQKQLHYLFEVRFVASEVLVLSHFLADLPAIVMYLRDEKDDADTSAETRAKIIGWLRTITQFKFVANMIVQLDIDAALKSFSVATQSDSLLVINYPGVRADFREKLRSLTSSLGQKARGSLADLSTGVLRATVAKKFSTRVVAGEEGDDVACDHVETLGDGTVRSKLVLKLSGCPRGEAATKEALLKYQAPDIRAMLDNFDARIVDVPLYGKFSELFNFEKMGIKSAEGAAFEQYLDGGGDAVEWLVKHMYPMLDPGEVKTQFLRVKIFVKENHDLFYDEDLPQPEWTDARKRKHVPKPRLRICGRGSIFEHLYRNPNVTGGPIEQYLHIADDMISRSVTQCDTERVGSNMNLIKTKLRTVLADSTFAALVFLSFNLPWLHEIDVKLLVKAWKEAGHKLPINKNDADSLVLTRLRCRDSDSRGFFLKTGHSFKPTDFQFLRTSDQ